ncbi:hypothetical protein [Pseudomonas sp. AA-38]|uniref:hypothetical protein n=1 Tax=Pseudomonas sp. AA-38 TaxID=3028807 RepID=UPI0023F93E31|nr:hypothetical protein [Pseudomonas sp. AA-38]
MDKILESALSNQIFQWIIAGSFVILAIMLIVLFIQYNIDRARGRHAKFLWFEVNAVQPSPASEPLSQQKTITGKNINTGTNHGEIGDKYTGLQQREVTQEDIEFLKQEISRFSTQHSEKIVRSHITLGYPGCKETTFLANQLAAVLQKMGFNKIVPMNLQTFGVIGKKFGVSNAPDNSLMIEIYPADNVE